MLNSDIFMEYSFIIMILCIFSEMILSFIQGKHFYRLNVLVADVSTGVIFALVGVVVLAGALIAYNQIETSVSLSTMGYKFFILDSPFSFSPSFAINWHALGSWTLALILTDFIYYWFHRHCHTFNFLWGTHVTHHSTQEMNLSVAFRGNGLQRIFEYTYFLPMAMLGIPWPMFLLCHRILKVYQFFVHTRYFGKLGIFEKFMVTPSNHRVHHGTQFKYLDKNHGGIFIIWDRLFNSFEDETDEPIYGLTKPINSFNPITVNFHVYYDILKNLFKVKTIGDAFGLFFKEPGWKPEYLRTQADIITEPAYTEKYNPVPPMGVIIYVALQTFVLMIVGLVIWKFAKLDLNDGITLALVSIVIVFSLFSINRTMEMKRWSRRTEVVRNVLFIGIFVYSLKFSSFPFIEYFAIPLTGLSIISLVWIMIKRKTFFDLTNIKDSWY